MRDFFRRHFIHKDSLKAAFFEVENLRAVIPWRHEFVRPAVIMLPVSLLVFLILLVGLLDSSRFSSYLVAGVAAAVLYFAFTYFLFKLLTNPNVYPPFMMDIDGAVGRTWFLSRTIQWSDAEHVTYENSLFSLSLLPVHYNLHVNLKDGSERLFVVPDLDSEEFVLFMDILSQISAKSGFQFTSNQ